MAEEPPSFHLATMPSERLIVAAYDQKVVMTRLEDRGGSNNVELLTTWTAPQRIRSIALFHHQASRKLLLVAAGDGKMMHCYDVTPQALSASHPNQRATSFCGGSPLVCAYGPHIKKISHVCAADDDVILADKFGEVYRLRLGYDETTGVFSAVGGEANSSLMGGESDEDEEDKQQEGRATAAVSNSELSSTSPPTFPIFEKKSVAFLLQHFSILTQLFVTEAVPRRLISCDREGHTRVSKYPNTFVINQFLWNTAPQSPVTCIAELEHAQCEGVVVVTGDAKGRVTFWCDAAAGPSAPVAAGNFRCLAMMDLQAFHAQSTAHEPQQGRSTACCGGVVGIVFLRDDVSDAFGVLVALDKAEDLFFCPVRVGGFTVEVCQGSITRVPVSRPVVGLASAGPASALVILRGNAATEHTVAVLESDGLEDSSRVRVVDVPNSPLATEWNSMGLDALDVFAYWRPVAAKDPRTTKHAAEIEGVDDGVDEPQDGEKQPKRVRTQ